MIYKFYYFVQREESMKRLLEWKQRMLQSPLTKKPTPRSGCPSPSIGLYTSTNALTRRAKTPDGALNAAHEVTCTISTFMNPLLPLEIMCLIL